MCFEERSTSYNEHKDMKAAIIVYSETGFTRRYADWIAEETGLEVLELNKKFLSDKDMGYDLLVFGSPVYGGELGGRRGILRTIRRNPDAQVLCFAVGLSPVNEETAKKVKNAAFGGEVSCPVFFFPGGLDKDRLEPSRRTELFLYRMMMKRQPDKSETIRHLLKQTENSCDLTDRAAIAPLTQQINTCLRQRKEKML